MGTRGNSGPRSLLNSRGNVFVMAHFQSVSNLVSQDLWPCSASVPWYCTCRWQKWIEAHSTNTPYPKCAKPNTSLLLSWFMDKKAEWSADFLRQKRSSMSTISSDLWLRLGTILTFKVSDERTTIKPSGRYACEENKKNIHFEKTSMGFMAVNNWPKPTLAAWRLCLPLMRVTACCSKTSNWVKLDLFYFCGWWSVHWTPAGQRKKKSGYQMIKFDDNFSTKVVFPSLGSGEVGLH